ncbi:MAG: YbaB/EbfC family nucleoid-associated protein [Sporomusaceae bacterium]|nr:YbaB/EbfC family nucleoid-associated protein [Sporomusaceae bacterium]
MLEQVGNVMEMVKRLQQNVANMEEQLKQELIEVSGSDVVRATLNGQQEIIALEINPKYLTPESATLLQDLLITTINNGFFQSKEMHKSAMDKLAGELNLPKIPGLF